jgi:DNA modification methylase
MKKIPNKSIDLVLTDPPYNASNSNIGFKDGYKTINEEWDKNFNPCPFLETCFNKIKNGGSVIVFCSYHLLGIYLNYKAKIQQIIHWEHISAMPAIAKVYTPVVEYMVWYSTPRYCFNKKEAHTNILRVRKGHQVDGAKYHPSQKPSNIMGALLRVHSNKNDLILDPFMGSGTTGVACKELGRGFIGIEINKDYYDIAKKRIANTQGSLF